MGIDFIRRTSGKPYSKRWARGLDRTKSPTLFDVRLTEQGRTLTATLTRAYEPQINATVMVQVAGPDLVVFDGLKQLARVNSAPGDVRAELVAQHGMAPAIIRRIGTFGDTIEVQLK